MLPRSFGLRLDAKRELLRRGKFEIAGLSKKQSQAFRCLKDPITEELVYGGGARGGKSYLGAEWLVDEILSKPGSQWLIARHSLKDLKRTTLVTFDKVLKANGLKEKIDYKYNGQDAFYTFFHELGDVLVYVAELKEVPRDPEFDRLGSYDLTGAWIDEAQQISKGAKDALQARFSLTAGAGWKTCGKCLYTCNPKKNWIYSDFWKPLIKEKKEIKGSQFITALYSDNPFIDREQYRNKILRTKNKIKIERLLKGNFEYDDDPQKIYDYDAILNAFTNEFVSPGDKYLSCDLAMQGSDLFVGFIWSGMRAKLAFVVEKANGKDIENIIKETCKRNNIPQSNVVYDSDGLGNFLKGYLENAYNFKNGAKALNDESYRNLKTQCAFKFAELLNENKVYIDCNIEQQEVITEELAVIKQINVDNDKYIEMIRKKDIKELLGRSPDFFDALIMRMVFEIIIKKPKQKFFGGVVR